jgi:hypothetical protein
MDCSLSLFLFVAHLLLACDTRMRVIQYHASWETTLLLIVPFVVSTLKAKVEGQKRLVYGNGGPLTVHSVITRCILSQYAEGYL